jgi:thioredoxin-like negative regulator of GroEL
MTEPVVDAIAEERAATLKVGKLQVDRNPLMTRRYEVLGVPTFVLFLDGEILARRSGAQAKRQLLRMIDKALASKADS